jgi:hypothetical protein
MAEAKRRATPHIFDCRERVRRGNVRRSFKFLQKRLPSFRRTSRTKAFLNRRCQTAKTKGRALMKRYKQKNEQSKSYTRTDFWFAYIVRIICRRRWLRRSQSGQPALVEEASKRKRPCSKRVSPQPAFHCRPPCTRLDSQGLLMGALR